MSQVQAKDLREREWIRFAGALSGFILRRKQDRQNIRDHQDGSQHPDRRQQSARTQQLTEDDEAKHGACQIHEAFHPGSQSAAVLVHQVRDEPLLPGLGDAGRNLNRKIAEHDPCQAFKGDKKK